MTHYFDVLSAWLVVVLGVFAVSCNLSLNEADEEGDNGDGDWSDQGGAVGFATGSESSGTVPDGFITAEAPQVSDLAVESTSITQGEPLTVSVSFEDAQGDVSVVYYGIEGESAYYTLSIYSLASGSVTGTVLLELYPQSYVPGNYVLNISLGDYWGNVGPMATVSFSITGSSDYDPSGYDTSWDGDPWDTSWDTEDDTADDTEGAGTDASGTDDDTITTGSGPPFVMGYLGDSGTGEPPALVLVTPQNGEAVIETLTEIVPSYVGGYVHDYNAGRLAYAADSDFHVEDRSPIVAIDVDNPSNARWAPVPPSGDPDFYYEVPYNRPQVLSDGRIVYEVIYHTTNPYDDFYESQLALWDPDTDDLYLQGGLSDWHKARPEVEACNPDCDMEVGYHTGAFAVSKDDRYAYQHIMGLGTEMLMISTGYSYLARWDLLTGDTESLLFLDTPAEVWGVTGDGNYVVISHDSDWKQYDVASGTLSTFYDDPTYLRAGQASDTGANIMMGWRQCETGYGGVLLFDLAMGTSTRIIDPEYYESSYKGINGNVQMNGNAGEVYYTASSDSCTNYDVEFVVMKSPIIENNPNPTTLMTLSGQYTTNFFVVLQ